MTLTGAKAHLDPGVGEPTSGFISANDMKLAFDDLQDAWQTNDQVKAVTNVTATYTILDTDRIVIATANSFTATLPPAGTAGRIVRVKNVASGQTFTVDGDGAETIDGAASKAYTQWQGNTLMDDGANWITLP